MTLNVDIGHNHSYELTCWSPDRDLNPQYKDVPDIDPLGAIVHHLDKRDPSKMCMSGVYFDLPNVRAVIDSDYCWQVESLEPLSISPSLLCTDCGDHGFIKNGRWINA